MTASAGRFSDARKFWGIAILIVVLMLGGAAAYAWVPPSLTSALALQQAKPLPYDPTRITVKFRAGIDRARIADVLTENGCTVSFAARFTPGLMDIRIPAGADFREWVKTFAARPDVQYAEPCYLDYPAFTPNDPSYPLQWHLQQVGLPRAWDILPSRGSSSVTVCVLDTGVAYENYSTFTQAPDLAGLIFVDPKDIWSADDHPNDENGHGTHVTGTIAQRTNNGLGVAGTADGVRIMPVRTLGPHDNTHTIFSDGVHWATDHGAKIINYSGGGGDSTTKHDAVIYAYNAGVLFIAAMGNSGVADPSDGYPGRYAEAMGVVATRYDKTKSWYSSYGADADISAPGGDTGVDQNSDGNPDGVLQQTYNTANDPSSGFGLQWYQGTSMATPHVSGLAALIWSQGKYTTRATVRSRLEGTCEDLGAAGKDNDYGWGLIRADRSLSPWLWWVGTAGYASNGVDPDDGDPNDAGSPTTFTFRVRYQDGSGSAPLKARCVLHRMDCAPGGGVTWRQSKNVPMTLESGTIADGAVYAYSTTLPNEVFKYRFLFQAADGSIVGGTPSEFAQGPLLRGRPHLCWTGAPGFANDGVDPDSGPAGTNFKFQVLYRDSWGSAPVSASLIIFRNGKLFRNKALTAEPAGDLRTGKVYRVSCPITKSGTYKYRFLIADGIGNANGDPATWQSAPSITGALGVLSSLAAAPTNAGAQITFNLADAAEVTATVMNVAGRPVKSLIADRSLEAGLQTLTWDRKGDGGLAVPAGIYLIKVVARDADGEQSSAMATVALR